MYVHRKREKSIIFVTFTLFMLFLLWLISEKDTKEVFIKTETVEEFCQNENVGICKLGNNINGGNTEILISWWEVYETDKKYFFLPSGSWKQEFVWLIPESMSLWIKNEKIKTGDKFDLIQGEYEIVVEKNNEKDKYVLRVLESSKIATLFITIEDNTLEYVHQKKGNEVTADYLLLDSQGKIENLGKVESFRGRGNSSWGDFEKKNYQLTLKEKKSLLGMPAEKQWILIPNAVDNTLIKNKICLDLARGLDLAYTPECDYIDLYIDGEYRGNYLLSEKVEIDDNRISINNLEDENERLNSNIELSQDFRIINDNGGFIKGSVLENEPQEITGGYLFELETPKHLENEKSGFTTSRGQCVSIQSPKYASQKQVSYVASLYQCFENAIYSENGCCPYDGKKFTEIIDIESFAKKYLIEELSKNHDAHLASQYFYKPEDAISNKIFAGPAWDYDKTLGVEMQNALGLDLSTPDGIHVGAKKREYDMWYGLYSQEEFKKVVYEILKKELKWVVKKELKSTLPKTIEIIRDSVKMNHVRWNIYKENSVEKKIECFEGEVRQIETFLDNRIRFLEDEFRDE